MAFLHLSLWRQKTTLDTFSGDGFGRLGRCLSFNPAGVPLFRNQAPWLAFSLVLALSDVLFELHWPSLSSWFLNGFEAACIAGTFLSSSFVGLSSSFFMRSERNVRHFFGGWFWQVGPLLELESCWGSAVAEPGPLACFFFGFSGVGRAV